MANEAAPRPAGAAHGVKDEVKQERGTRQEVVGVVTSSKMAKTIVVKVTRTTQASAVSAGYAFGEEVLRAR